MNKRDRQILEKTSKWMKPHELIGIMCGKASDDKPAHITGVCIHGRSGVVAEGPVTIRRGLGQLLLFETSLCSFAVSKKDLLEALGKLP